MLKGSGLSMPLQMQGSGRLQQSNGLVGPTGKVGNQIPSGYKAGQMAQFTPEQVALFKQLFSNVSPDSYLGRLSAGDEDLFGEMEAPAMRQFNALQGNIASRFSGMGMGGRRSSGFQNAMTAASSNFAQDLQSRRQDLQRQAIMDLMGLSGNLLQQRPYESFLVEKQQKQNPMSGFLGGLGGAIPGAIGGFFTGGPAGALAGGALGAASGYAGAKR